MEISQAWKDLLHPGDATDFFERRVMPAFDVHASQFHLGNAICLAELSRLVYRHDLEEDSHPPVPRRSDFLAHAGFEQRAFFQNRATNTQAMLVQSTGAAPFAVLAFRGTEQNIKDFLIDLEVGMPPWQQAQLGVHDGFERSLLSIWHEIAPKLQALTCPIFFTGHSLGAALATLAASYFAPQAAYIFGSPRVGNQAFVDSVSSVRLYRVVDDEDIVCTVPMESLGFRHAGEEHRLYPAASAGAGFSLRDVLDPIKALADHAPVNYVDRLV